MRFTSLKEKLARVMGGPWWEADSEVLMEDIQTVLTAVLAASAALLPFVSSSARRVLAAIFLKPRTTSVIITTVEGRIIQVDVKGLANRGELDRVVSAAIASAMMEEDSSKARTDAPTRESGDGDV
ncbi:hypothetical protein ACFVUB_11105 [Streptomyces niveus]|uniref:hypothetical protein n=1 Tax=Streptomyces niveus TaxID=193462 RepID=UPI0036DEBC92